MDMHPKPLSTHVARRQKQKRQKVIEKQRQKELKRQRELAKCENMTESELRKLRQSDSKAQSRQKLKVCFQRNHVEMLVADEDLVNDPPDDSVHSDLIDGSLVLRRSHHPKVQNCCVICLEAYKPDDHVVWSCNKECEHAFHRTCIMKYLSRIHKKAGSTPCPCCRRDFTDLDVQKPRSGPVAALAHMIGL